MDKKSIEKLKKDLLKNKSHDIFKNVQAPVWGEPRAMERFDAGREGRYGKWLKRKSRPPIARIASTTIMTRIGKATFAS